MQGKSEAKVVLPPIPAKRYFTIGEVSDLCGVKPHVLRYWEQEFTQLRPMKRRGNRRYYQHHEVLLIRRIRELLYEEGFTINGARNRLSEMGGGRVRASATSPMETVGMSAGTEASRLANGSGLSGSADGAGRAEASSAQQSLLFASEPASDLGNIRSLLEEAKALLSP